MHPVIKDFDILFNLLVAHQILKVRVRIVTLFRVVPLCLFILLLITLISLLVPLLTLHLYLKQFLRDVMHRIYLVQIEQSKRILLQVNQIFLPDKLVFNT